MTPGKEPASGGCRRRSVLGCLPWPLLQHKLTQAQVPHADTDLSPPVRPQGGTEAPDCPSEGMLRKESAQTHQLVPRQTAPE